MEHFIDLEQFAIKAVEEAETSARMRKAERNVALLEPGSNEWKLSNEIVRAWERKEHWEAVTYEARFDEEKCECGCSSVRFVGYFSVARHKTKPTVERKRVGRETVKHLDLVLMHKETDVSKVSDCENCWCWGKEKDEEESRAASKDGGVYSGVPPGTGGRAVV